MKKLVFLFLLTPMLLILGCENNNDDDPILCTQEFVDGLHVTVIDATSGQPLVENVSVKAKDGSYEENLELVPGLENLFAGAGERAGTYTVTVTKPGYQNYVSTPIVVTRDVCHVLTKSLTVTLHSN